MENTNFGWLLQNQERFNPARGVSFGGLFAIFQDLPKPLFRFWNLLVVQKKFVTASAPYLMTSPQVVRQTLSLAHSQSTCVGQVHRGLYRTVPYRTDKDHKINQSQRRFLIEGDKKGHTFSAELSFRIQ